MARIWKTKNPPCGYDHREDFFVVNQGGPYFGPVEHAGKLEFIARRRAEQGDSAGAQGRAQGPPKAEPGLPGGGEAITRRAAAAA